jgi:HD-GYP domain-containing protein (c-di-GMP phosphodiesterase class II)
MAGKGSPVPQRQTVPLIDLVTCLSDAMDAIAPAVVRHHTQVASLAHDIAAALHLSDRERRQVILAAALHDIGAFSLRERIDLLRFETEQPSRHAARGAAILQLCAPLAALAPIVRSHHLAWDNGRGARRRGEAVPLASHIIHLADRVSILVQANREILGQRHRIVAAVRGLAGSQFHPGAVEAFADLAVRESFWLDLAEPALAGVLAAKMPPGDGAIGFQDLEGFSLLVTRVIDFKSPFTATHSRGVAATAASLARLCGMSAEEAFRMGIAANLHDLGKLAVPVEILDKPARLNLRERHVVRHHAYYTRRILERVPALAEIIPWAADHHERLDGSGYPFHLQGRELPLGSRVMAVADVFTALTENRPYRPRMSKAETAPVLWGMVRDGALSGEIVNTFCGNCDHLDELRKEAQREAAREYRTVR